MAKKLPKFGKRWKYTNLKHTTILKKTNSKKTMYRHNKYKQRKKYFVPDAKSKLIRKDSDLGKTEGRKIKGQQRMKWSDIIR